MALTKDQALEGIRQFAVEAGLSVDDVVGAMAGANVEPPAASQADTRAPAAASEKLPALKVTEVFAYIGAIIVVIGLTVLVAQNWESFGVATRLMLTLGVGGVFYGTATYLMTTQQLERVANAFHIIGAYALAMGVGVVLYTNNLTGNRLAWVIAAATLALLYGVSDYVFKRIVFSFFATMFATLLYWAAIALCAENWVFGMRGLIAYAAMVIGGAYIGLLYAWRGTRRAPLKDALAAFGTLYILGGAYTLTYGDAPVDYMWLMLFPGILALALYGSTQLHSNSMFVFTVLWMVAYIFTVTARFFAQTTGWPIALMVAGLALIGVGYVAVGIKNKYLRTK